MGRLWDAEIPNIYFGRPWNLLSPFPPVPSPWLILVMGDCSLQHSRASPEGKISHARPNPEAVKARL